jgi:hypothetical protein
MTSDAATILGQLTKLGCRVTARGDTLRVEASGVVPADLLQAAREHKADLLELVAGGPLSAGAVHPLLLLPLDAFAAQGQPIEIRVPWWAQTLWFVPDESHARRLEAEGVSRGRIWTAGELSDLLGVRDQPRAARMVAIAKLEFGGEVVEVRLRG